MSFLFGLVGNQNCGKTTLFNALTGSNQHVGNFPGVTVERKEGRIKPELLHIATHHDYQIGRRKKRPDRKQESPVLVDLPGIYSLSPYTSEEIVTRDFVLEDKPDVIINILDATNLERNLYLTLQLMELNIPLVLALNMMDEIRASGNSIDIPALCQKLSYKMLFLQLLWRSYCTYFRRQRRRYFRVSHHGHARRRRQRNLSLPNKI